MTDMDENQFARRNEDKIREQALSLDLLPHGIFGSDCKGARGIAGGCPNGRKCRNKFAGLADVIMDFRRLIFMGLDGPDQIKKGRKFNLESLLLMGYQVTPEGPKISFTIKGIPVCKTFYRECTGLVRQFLTISCIQYFIKAIW
jgi:hypothetical protein